MVVILFTASIISFTCVFIPPEFFWPASIISFAILPIIVLHFPIIVILLILKKKIVILPILTLILGFFFIQLSFKIHRDNTSISDQYLSIMSYNVDFFSRGGNLEYTSKEMIDWVVYESSSIKCIQEYRSDNLNESFNVKKQLNFLGYTDFTYNFTGHNSEVQGLAIFSKLPIINSGTIILNEKSKNNCIFVDVKYNSDTLRIYNLHLSSMQVPKLTSKNLANYPKYLLSVIKRLKYGAIKHSKELDIILTHTQKSPYNIIMCGDFNEVPYSYNYLKIRDKYLNSFEFAGNGFGFSFNGRLFFLRIDHHFVSPEIIPVKFQVDSNIDFSGHFPIKGLYQIL